MEKCQYKITAVAMQNNIRAGNGPKLRTIHHSHKLHRSCKLTMQALYGTTEACNIVELLA